MAFLSGTSAHAQFPKGTRMVGASVANLSFNSGTSEQDVESIGNTTAKVTGFDISLSPSLGWFISENTVVGFTFTVEPSKERISFEENGSTFQRDETNRFNIGIGGFVRNYFSKSGKMLPFGQFGVNGGISNFRQEGFFYGGTGGSVYKESYDSKSTGGFFANANFLAGVTWMMGEYTGLDLAIGYNFNYNKHTLNTTRLRDEGIDGVIEETGKNETTTRYSLHRFQLSLGFQIFLAKRK